MNGKYYVIDNRYVYRDVAKNGKGITMGFRVCECDEWTPPGAAQHIADALNEKQERDNK